MINLVQNTIDPEARIEPNTFAPLSEEMIQVLNSALVQGQQILETRIQWRKDHPRESAIRTRLYNLGLVDTPIPV